MKRMIGLITGMFMTGTIYADTVRDTVPVGMENYPSKKTLPTQSATDTLPFGKVTLDTSAKWKSDTMPSKKWSQDSMNNKWDSAAKKGEGNKGEGNFNADTSTNKKLPDRVMMKDDVMVIIRNGVETKMEKTVMLESGSVITVDGTVKKKDGTFTKLKNGQYIALPPEKMKKPGE